MIDENRNVLMVGLPSSGKTTYLAAVYYASQAPEAETSLRMEVLPNQTGYLDDILRNLLEQKSMPRTQLGSVDDVPFTMRDCTTGERFTLSLPDMIGEEYNHQLEERECSEHYTQLVSEATGLLLFVHPSVVKPLPILKRDKIARRATPVTIPDISAPHEFAKAPTAVKLVELLQFALSCRDGRPLRLSIVVSAWDIEDGLSVSGKKARTPLRWLAEEVSLLSQFLEANDDVFRTRVFGVSAQGGQFDEGETLTTETLERVFVVDGKDRSSDLTLPIRWAVGFA